MDDKPDATLAGRRTRRDESEARRAHAAGVLLDTRRDLEGISPVAEHFRDAARWSA